MNLIHRLAFLSAKNLQSVRQIKLNRNFVA
jgi:hypothetical protein